MSEFINNKEQRQKRLKEILMEIHDNVPIEVVKEHFREAFSSVDATELAEAERALVEGGLPVSEIQNLCNIHAEIVGQSVEQIHNQDQPLSKSHPIEVMRLENTALLGLLTTIRKDVKALPLPAAIKSFHKGFESLRDINKHYLRKENLIFPYMEKHGIDTPPKVMWGVHDEIRTTFKKIDEIMSRHALKELKTELPALLDEIEDMVDKEENILFPMIEKLFEVNEWQQIIEDSDEFGYFLINVPEKEKLDSSKKENQTYQLSKEDIDLKTGALTQEELIGLLEVFPLDITFVGKEDEVRYFSHGESRVFPRTMSVIGRNVENCHPQASVHIVKELLNDFKSGKKDKEDFWIQMGERLILIRYFAVRRQGEYIGVVELTQDIAPIQKITGEKRIMD